MVRAEQHEANYGLMRADGRTYWYALSGFAFYRNGCLTVFVIKQPHNEWRQLFLKIAMMSDKFFY